MTENQLLPFHKQLIHERHQRGLSQEKFAELIGVDPKTLGRWEQGKTLPGIQQHERLSQIFGKTVVELGLYRENEYEAEPVQATQSDNFQFQPNSIQERFQLVLRNNAVVDHDLLYGVDDLIDKVGSLLSVPHGAHIISIYGEGGVGKTALAYEIVSRYASVTGFTRMGWVSAKTSQLLPDGTLLRTSSAELRWSSLIKKLADQMDIEMGESSIGWMSDFQEGIRLLPINEKCLCVIDNLETVEDVTEAIQFLCGNQILAPHKILITTRFALLGRAHNVMEKKVTGLDLEAALKFIRSLGNEDIEQASDNELKPIVDATEGNPLLIKLFVTQFLMSHLPLPMVLKTLHAVNSRLREDVVDYLYACSLSMLSQRCGEDNAHKIMAAFCPLGEGEAVNYNDLLKFSNINDESLFQYVLRTACDLSLIRSLKLNSKYSIHSLLWSFVCD